MIQINEIIYTYLDPKTVKAAKHEVIPSSNGQKNNKDISFFILFFESGILRAYIYLLIQSFQSFNNIFLV